MPYGSAPVGVLPAALLRAAVHVDGVHPGSLRGGCAGRIGHRRSALRRPHDVDTTHVNGRSEIRMKFKRTPFALRKGSFCYVKGLVLQGKRGRFELQKDSF